jgi:uncharacterized protein YkwD
VVAVAAALGTSMLLGGGDPATASTSTSGLVAATSLTYATSSASTSEQQLATKVNNARTAAGRHRYTVVSNLSKIAEAQARRMANKQQLYHNPHLTTDVHVWSAIGENVAYASSVSAAHQALMNSSGHKANILSRTFTQAGIGVVKDSHGRVWVCEVFRKP